MSKLLKKSNGTFLGFGFILALIDRFISYSFILPLAINNPAIYIALGWLLTAFILGFLYAAYAKEDLNRIERLKIISSWFFFIFISSIYDVWLRSDRQTHLLLYELSLAAIILIGFSIANFFLLRLGSALYHRMQKK